MREQVEVGMRKDSDLKLPMSLTPMFHRINLNNESIWEWLPPTKDAASGKMIRTVAMAGVSKPAPSPDEECSRTCEYK